MLWYQELNLLGHDADVDGLGVAMVCAAVKAQWGMAELCKFDMAGATLLHRGDSENVL